MRRAAITEFRSNVAYRLEAILRESPEHESHIRRALGIPASIPLLPNRWQVAGQFGLFFCRRQFCCIARIRCLGGCAASKAEITSSCISSGAHSLDNDHYYDDRLDFSLRRFRPARTVQALEHLQRFRWVCSRLLFAWASAPRPGGEGFPVERMTGWRGACCWHSSKKGPSSAPKNFLGSGVRSGIQAGASLKRKGAPRQGHNPLSAGERC